MLVLSFLRYFYIWRGSIFVKGSFFIKFFFKVVSNFIFFFYLNLLKEYIEFFGVVGVVYFGNLSGLMNVWDLKWEYKELWEG